MKLLSFLLRFLPRGTTFQPLVEAGTMLAITLAIGWTVWRHDPFFLQVTPHPYWLVILMISVRYGMPAGPITGLGCAILHLIAITYAGTSLHEAFQLGTTGLFTPLLYVLAAVFVSEGIDQSRRRCDFYLGQVQEMKKRLDGNEAKRSELEQAYRQVEGRLAGRTDTIIAFYEQARKLGATEPVEIYAGLVGMLQQHLDVDRCGVWVAGGDRVFRKVAPDADANAALPALGKAVLEEGTVLSASEFYAKDDPEPGAGVLAGPLRTVGLRIDAVVVIEVMRFIAFTPTAARRFELLLEWASRSLTNAARMSEREQAVPEAEPNRITGRFQRVRTLEELAATQRKDQASTLMICQIEGEMAVDVRRRLEQAVRRICRNLSRPTDVVSFRDEERACIMFLPGGTLQGTDALRDRIERTLVGFDFRPYADGSLLQLRWGRAESKGTGVSLEQMMAAALAPEGRW